MRQNSIQKQTNLIKIQLTKSPFFLKNAKQFKAVLKSSFQINTYFSLYNKFAKCIVLALF